MLKIKHRHVGITTTLLVSTLLLLLVFSSIGVVVKDVSSLQSSQLQFKNQPKPKETLEGIHGIRKIKSIEYDEYDSNINQYPKMYSGAAQSVQANRSRQHVLSPYTSEQLSRSDVKKVPQLVSLQELTLAASAGKRQYMGKTELYSHLSDLYSRMKHPEDVPFERFGINVTKSKGIQMDRKLKDSRAFECKTQSYHSFKLPNVSIIIPFYNEHHSVLIRTIHSILNTVPDSLIHEILLIDDFSDHSDLKEPLEEYVKSIPKMKLFRTLKREGLIRARMQGARISTGQVLVFLDAHVEMVQGWLQPLLLEIYKDKTAVTIPHIGYIKSDSLEPTEFNRNEYGSFSWELDFVWQDIPSHLRTRPATEPLDSATMIGCAFAIDRQFFFKLGGYDEGLEIWGGENLEISFRTWMCGGSLKLVQCSRIFHIFRPILPYTVTDHVLYGNLWRVAEVWMDDYKHHFLNTIMVDLTKHQLPSTGLSERKQLRSQLKCHDFSWYLRRTSQELMEPKDDSVYFGQLKNLYLNGCMNVSLDGDLSIDYCPLYLALQTFSYTTYGLILHEASGKCLTFTSQTTLSLTKCNAKDHYQIWKYDPNIPNLTRLTRGVDFRKPTGAFWMQHGNKQMCLTQVTKEGKYFPRIATCEFNLLDQYWVFTHKVIQRVKL